MPMASSTRKLMTSPAPMRRPGVFFRLLFRLSHRMGRPPRIRPTKVRQVARTWLASRYSSRKTEAHDADNHADAQGNEQLHALLEMFEQAGDGTDELVVDAHGYRHGAARHAGDDVGDTDDDPAQNIQYSIHKTMLSFLSQSFANGVPGPAPRYGRIQKTRIFLLYRILCRCARIK